MWELHFYRTPTESDLHNLEEQLVLGEALDRFQEVRVQAQLVVQLLLALLQRDTKRE